MADFPRIIPDSAKAGDVYGPAMAITDQGEADEYFRIIVDDVLRKKANINREQAESIVRQNLGYWAGYYDSETRSRVERLFNCAHPFFGKIDVHGPPTPETALGIGKALGAAAKSAKQGGQG